MRLEYWKNKDYKIMFSSRHSGYTTCESNLTLLEAFMKGRYWEKTKENVGGSALIYEVINGDKISLGQAEEILRGDIENLGLYEVVSILTEKYKAVSIELKKIDNTLEEAMFIIETFK